MKHFWTFCVVLVCLSIGFGADVANAQAKSNKPLIAVLEVLVPSEAGSTKEGLYSRVKNIEVDLATELRKGGKVEVLPTRQLETSLKRNNLTLANKPDKETAVKIGKILGVNYLLMSEVKRLELINDTTATRTQSLTLAVTASLINTSTGEIVWTGEASHSEPLTSSGPGTNAATAEQRALDLAIKPVVQKLTASLRDANLFS